MVIEISECLKSSSLLFRHYRSHCEAPCLLFMHILSQEDIYVASSTTSLTNALDFVLCRCAYHGGSFGRGQTKALQCSQPRVGRYVFVKLRVNEYLTLCEVEVMAVSGM